MYNQSDRQYKSYIIEPPPAAPLSGEINHDLCNSHPPDNVFSHLEILPRTNFMSYRTREMCCLMGVDIIY